MKWPALLHLNVLVSLFDPAHPHHKAAHTWFRQNRSLGWATCAVTHMGCNVAAPLNFPEGSLLVQHFALPARFTTTGLDHGSIIWESYSATQVHFQ